MSYFWPKQELEVSNIFECPESLFSWELSFTPHAQEGQSSGIWRNPWQPNIIRTTKVTLSGVTLEKVSANHDSWASTAPGHCHGFAGALRVLLLLGASPSPIRALLVGLFFFFPLWQSTYRWFVVCHNQGAQVGNGEWQNLACTCLP